VRRRRAKFQDLGAAPHPPAGTFSPYKDGEKKANRQPLHQPASLDDGTPVIGESRDDSLLLPSLYGEKCRQAMRGGAEASEQGFADSCAR